MLTHFVTILAQAPAPGTTPGGGSNFLLWGVLLIALGLSLLLVEFFVPSAGIIALTSSICVVSGIVCIFYRDTTLGLAATVIVLVLVPFVIGWGLHMLPHTPLFRWLSLPNPPRNDADKETSESLVGKEGVAIKDLHPIGPCTIDGKRHECLSRSGLIKAGSRIRVTSEDAFQIKVIEIHA